MAVQMTLPGGKTNCGSYTVEKGSVCVTYQGPSKASRIGGIPINWYAKVLLRELVTETA